MARLSRMSAALASAAALSMAATPVLASEVSVGAAQPRYAASAPDWSAEAVSAHQSRWHHRHHHDRVDAGDVLAGVLILGGIAAVASAVSNSDRDRDRPPVDYRYPRPAPGYQSGGIDRAVDMCVAEVERNARVASVEGVDRDAAGWRVRGSLYDGGGFSCSIGNDGRISDIDLGRDGDVRYDGAATDRQWSDDDYAAAWNDRNGDPAPVQPAYPGGPLPGDDYDN